MKKEIDSVERFKPANDQGKREIIAVETTDKVRYIFVNDVDKEGAQFSHRFYPERSPNSQYQSSNHRLPEVVEKKIEEIAGRVAMMNGMMKEAHRNKEAVARFDGGNYVQSV